MKATQLKGARVLITGAGSGIGRLMALEAAGRGASIAVWDRDQAGADETVRLVEEAGVAATATVVDITDRAAVAAAAEREGAVDVVINNAGVVTGATLLEASDEAIERTFQVNTLALFWVTRAFLPGMIERDRGTVVTIASAAGLLGVARQTDYAASKSAAIGFTESLRAELREAGSRVRTLIFMPYYIDTGMFEGVRTRFPLLLPILDPHKAARRVIRGIERGTQQIMTPPMVRTVPVLRALPVRAFDGLADFFGINHGMDHFKGRESSR